MNYSNLPIYYSKENFTTRFIDYSNVYLLPLICLFGIITSFICILVASKRDETNSKTLDYILINSVVDFVFLVIQSFLFIIRCGVLCPYGYTYVAKFYEIYIYLYVGYVLVSSQVFLNVYLSIGRLKMFSGKLTSQKSLSIYRVYAICALISLAANSLPYLISRTVEPIGIFIPDSNSSYSEVLYARVFRHQFNTPVFQTILTVIMGIKDPFMFSFLCFLNVLVCLRFRKYLEMKKKLTKKVVSTEASTICVGGVNSNELPRKPSTTADRKETNFTLLTLLSCLIYIVGNFIDCFSMIIYVFSVDIYVKYGFVNITGNCLFFGSHGVPLFLYYYFNNVFRRKLNSLFKI